VIEREITTDSLAWWIENWTARFLWEKESNLCPLLLLRKRRTSLSWHHDLARGWPVEEYSKRNCAYGWVEKGTPFNSFQLISSFR
jgi:hypothetical protein